MMKPFRERRLRRTAVTVLCALVLLILAGCTASRPPATSASEDADGLRLQRVVMLMRHGIRPPTKAYVIPAGYASDPWPDWKVAPGYLTAHGYQGAVLLGRWDRRMLASRGMLAASGCPAAGTLVVWADTDQRTRQTGVGFVQGFAPGCGIQVGHAAGDRDDPLFHAFANRAVPYDQAKAKAAVLARAGAEDLAELGPLSHSLAAEFARLNAILGCCSLPLCKSSGLPGGCALGDIPYVWEKGDPHEEVDFVGPLSVGGTAAESILLEYANGKPMSDVGWGRAGVADLALLSKIHAAEFDVLERAPYNAYRGATPTLQRILEVFAGPDTARLTVLVGHDTNVANLGGTLELHWQAPGYARDDPAITGALGFELLVDSAGTRFVRAFYQAQGLKQLRALQPLNAAHPPYFHYLPQPLCALAGKPTLCTLAGFEHAARKRIVE